MPDTVFTSLLHIFTLNDMLVNASPVTGFYSVENANVRVYFGCLVVEPAVCGHHGPWRLELLFDLLLAGR